MNILKELIVAGPTRKAKAQKGVSIVIPAFNEDETIGEIVEKIRAVGPDFEIIVVDDGSSDGTAQAARDGGADIVLSAPYNVGNGASVRRGILASSGEIVVMMDSDGQHSPEEIPNLLKELDTYEMAVGARTSQSNTSRFRNFGNWALITVAQWISGHKILDLTSGFRAMRREVLMGYLQLFPNRFSYPTTITLSFLMDARFVTYVPMDSIQKRHHGASNIKPFRDGLRFIAIIFRILMLFNPKRLFVPLSGGIFLISILVGGYQYWATGGVQSAGLGLFMSSVIIGCFGLIADQVAALRRKI
jgi:glycosyltransferase involved in cell wall biosynthesis